MSEIIVRLTSDHIKVKGAEYVQDLVRCAECKWEWSQKCPPHRMGLIHDSNDFCSYGERKEK